LPGKRTGFVKYFEIRDRFEENYDEVIVSGKERVGSSSKTKSVELTRSEW